MTEEAKPEPSSTENFDIQAKIKEIWHGEVPLFQTFWIYYFVVIFVSQGVARILGGSIGLVIGVLALLWAGFMVRPIWIAAGQYKGNQSWARLAQIAAVLIAIGVVLNLL